MFFDINLTELEEKIERCETVDEFKTEVIPLIKEEKDVWSEKIQTIILESGLTRTEFAKKCGVSRVTVNKWSKGSIPKKRETFIKIGTVAGYNFEEMHCFLMQYGKCSGMYSKNRKRNLVNDYYRSLYVVIKIFLRINTEEEGVTINRLANNQYWTSSLKQCVSAVRQNRWIPTRNKIISLGLHLNLNREEIDLLLLLANMEILSPTNIIDATVLYILETADLNFPNATKYVSEYNYLFEYAADVIKKINNPELNELLVEFQNRD